jgi:hypothetical protein
VHLIHSLPWTLDTPVSEPPPVLVPGLLDSDDVIGVCLDLAGQLNAAVPGTIPAATHFAARLSGTRVWPEPIAGGVPTDVAWRVDFLELDERSPSDSTPVWWSLARFYIQPGSGQFLGPPILPPTGRELYPFP